MKPRKLTNIEELRRRAENYLTKHPSNSVLEISESDNLKLIHELRVHEIEFTMQNDELKLSNVQSESNVIKYSELYDFSPMGSFTLTKEGEIIELNLQGSNLLNKKQSDLISSQFGFFVVDEDKPIFYLFLEKVFISNVNETCVINLSLDENLTKHIILSGKIALDDKHCMIATIDNTKLIESELKLELTDSYLVYREFKMIDLKEEINGLLKKVGEEIKY